MNVVVQKLLKIGMVIGVLVMCLAASLSAGGELSGPVYDEYLENAESGDHKAMFFLGLLNERDLAPDASMETAISWYVKSAKAGGVDGAISAARLYHLSGNLKQAYEMYQIAASFGSPEGDYNLGYAHEYGKGVAKDIQLARRHYQKAAEAGMIPAMRQLGMIHWRGEGDKRDIPAAKIWLKQAAQAGDKISITLLNQLENADENFEKLE